MPALSSTMTEGKVVAWLKQEGDKVEMGEAVLVVESDKADMDVESYDEGYLAAIITGEWSQSVCGAPSREMPGSSGGSCGYSFGAGTIAAVDSMNGYLSLQRCRRRDDA